MKTYFSTILYVIITINSFATIRPFQDLTNKKDSIPSISNNLSDDILATTLTLKAAKNFKRIIAPQTNIQWQERKKELNQFIQEKTNYKKFNNLPLQYTEYQTNNYNDFTVKNISFQTRPNTHTTANLYVPVGNGKFPAILVMMGHSRSGKFYENYQLLGQDLAKNGYVALLVDPWGAGERTTEHLNFEYHGAHMGGHLMNIGETLMGMQITDNLRAIDLLTSFQFVDKDLIGATGASGGGNQTMWIAAVDERIKAAVPVVSVGTFESYIMNSNCICELLPDGLSYMEESEVLGLIAPRKLSIFNALHDANKAFFPTEMLRSYQTTNQIYKLYKAEKNLSYQIFNSTHGYWPEQRHAMIKWFNESLLGKIDTQLNNYNILEPLTQESLQVFNKNKRITEVQSTEQFCKQTASQLINNIDFNAIDRNKTLLKLKSNLKINDQLPIITTKRISKISEKWKNYTLSLSNDKDLSIRLFNPKSKTKFKIILTADEDHNWINDSIQSYSNLGYSIAYVNLSGLGDNLSVIGNKMDQGLPKLHTVSRSYNWLGQTMMGEWTEEIAVVSNFIKEEFNPSQISLYGNKELGVASILASTLSNNITNIYTYDSPISYIIENLNHENMYSLAIHIPGIINWGDLPLAIALSNSDIVMHSIRDITGKKISKEKVNIEKEKIKNYKSLIKNKSAINLKYM